MRLPGSVVLGQYGLTDLLAMLRLQLDHFGFLPLWELLQAALDGSLRRLQVDCIDLYQLHWPERDTNYFGRRGFTPGDADEFTPVAETLEALAGFEFQPALDDAGEPISVSVVGTSSRNS